ncbi:LLM class flavin-dependent oxidoreductase [Mycolicibacterium holsaticum DSM 44478 = JCM 12374]|nr:LLM class flavin-dependent oxidoreductase [Mycolicibacterium holsaticum DSM 44478 = JCM 12374]UNC11605.1 LLM class flavin-dependent oxidoreductase [Mycolicibacterium holsaticum DSM 44478 = JCM 12374]
MVLNNDLRHPVEVARETATVAAVSGGRFELGLGAGSLVAGLQNRIAVVAEAAVERQQRFGVRYWTVFDAWGERPSAMPDLAEVIKRLR